MALFGIKYPILSLDGLLFVDTCVKNPVQLPNPLPKSHKIEILK
jgi:hypothetical protein